MIGRRTTIRRRATQLSLWLLIGAAGTVLNAWFCAAFLPIGSTISGKLVIERSPHWYPHCGMEEWIWEVDKMSAWLTPEATGIPTSDYWPLRNRQWQPNVTVPPPGYVERENLRGTGFEFSKTGRLWGDDFGLQYAVTRYRSGWPCLAMTGSLCWMHSDIDGQNRGPLPLSAVEISPWGLSGAGMETSFVFLRILPLQPLWTGFIINTLVHASALWLLIRGPFTLRRWRRARRGLCLRCAYPIGQSEHCTECGSIVRQQSAME